MVSFSTLQPNNAMSGCKGTIFNKHGARCLTLIRGKFVPCPEFRRPYSEGKGLGKGPAKEETLELKMPGFVTPETIKEEGYFTQKAKKELEELKRKVEEKEKFNNPESKGGV